MSDFDIAVEYLAELILKDLIEIELRSNSEQE